VHVILIAVPFFHVCDVHRFWLAGIVIAFIFTSLSTCWVHPLSVYSAAVLTLFWDLCRDGTVFGRHWLETAMSCNQVVGLGAYAASMPIS